MTTPDRTDGDGLKACPDAPLFRRKAREGGYTFVTAPAFPGWSFMLSPVCPEAREREMRLSLVAFLEAEVRAAPQAPDTGEGTEPLAAPKENWDCFWPRCSDSKRCREFGSCVALAQRKAIAAGDFPAAPPKPAPDALREALVEARPYVKAAYEKSHHAYDKAALEQIDDALSASVQSGVVRGDREAIARALYDLNPSISSTQFSGLEPTHWCYDTYEKRLAYRQADSILSLQPTGDQPTPQVSGASTPAVSSHDGGTP